MARWAITDTGPLVAYFDRREAHHEWAAAQFDTLVPPLLVSEPVLTEAFFLLRRNPEVPGALMAALERNVLCVAFNLGDHVPQVSALMQKYIDTPMSLADACVVRMSELNEHHAVLTLDSDFSIYRRFGRYPLPLISPAAS